ncbi:MAG: flagellar assembly protein A, partial [Nannocystaceae bacterium]
MSEQEERTDDNSADTPPEVVGSADLSIEIAGDLLSARAKVNGGGRVTEDELSKLLQAKRVVHGVNHTICSRICSQVLEVGQSFVVAKGTKPLADLPARLELKFDPDILAGTRRADGTLDFSSRGALKPASADQVIAMELPPQEGTPGKNIRGEEVAFEKDTSKLKWSLGNNVERMDDGSIVAKIDGVISYEEGGKLDVTKHYEHRNPVDMRSGNLHTEGSITITGDVERNFYVRATEDIEIRGGVVGGSAYACGKIIIGRGAVAGEIG